jgi:putative addiction module component (TIGR02574 family)
MTGLPDVRKLSVPERLELLEHIWESLRSEDAAPGLTDDQKLEIDERLEAHEKGKAKSILWSEARERLMRRS